jgi:hypothetical protein
MIVETPLSKCFPDYTGPNEIKESLDFIQREFEKRMEDENKKRLHTYIVAARFKKVNSKISFQNLTLFRISNMLGKKSRMYF